MNKTAQIVPAQAWVGLRMLGAGRYTMTNSQPTTHPGQDHWLLEMFVSGALQVAVRPDQWVTVSPGLGVLYRPGTTWYERLPPRTRAACVSVSMFFTAVDSDVLTPLEAPAEPLMLVEDADGVLATLLNRIIDSQGRGVSGTLLVHGCLCQAVAVLLSARWNGRTLRVSGGPEPEAELVERAHRFMKRHLSEPIRVADLARHTGMTPSGFAHAYHRITGHSPMATLRAFRVQWAKMHLLRGRLRLADIARRTGFADAFHLSRTFKKVVGDSPRKFLQARAQSGR